MKDTYDRKINYMRLSITDRCNLRCRYCMPNGVREKVPMTEILRYEELVEIAEAAVSCGITRFKVTGGEPLVRKDCAAFVGMLKKLPGAEQVTMTTNGVLLSENLPALVSAGLDAVNVSLDTLQAARFREITGVDGCWTPCENQRGFTARCQCLRVDGARFPRKIRSHRCSFHRDDADRLWPRF